MAPKLFLQAIYFYLLVSTALGQQHFQQSQKCRLQNLRASHPFQQIQHEAGVTEMWNENEEQFQCAGVAPIRNVLQPNSLSLPNFHPSPRLVFIEEGEGLTGVIFPGCAESFHSPQGQQEGGAQKQESADKHQRVHRVRKGDIVVIPAGAAHWTFNDGNQELVAVSITDLNNPSNQLDRRLRSFYLAGSPPKQGQQGQQGRQKFHNIFNAFDENLMAEAFDVSVDTVRRMQKEDDRGLIVKVQEGMRMVRPDAEEEMEQGGQRYSNGLEETFCSMKIRASIDNRREADVFSRQAGSLNIVNQYKLPLLQLLDMSAERGRLQPNAIFVPHWPMNSHSIVYITRGNAEVQIVGENGQNLMNNQVNERQMFIVPQFFAATMRAGQDGVEWVSFKTSSQPMDSPLSGYTSVLKSMPVQVLANAFQISQGQAQSLKSNMERDQSFLISPQRRMRSSP